MAYLRAHSATWEGHRLYAVVGLALLAGLRRSEVLELRRDQFVSQRSTLLIPRRPPIRLGPDATGILEEWLDRADRVDSPWVFPGTLLVGPWTGGTKTSKIGPEIRRASRKVGIAGRITIECLRRFWLDSQGQVELGRAWRASQRPEPILIGPQPKHRSSAPRRRMVSPGGWPLLATWAPDAVPAVEVGKPHEPVLFKGRPKGPLTRSEHVVMAALRGAWPGGLSLSDLEAACGTRGCRTTLRRLLDKDPEWSEAIQFPQKGYPGSGDRHVYRIKPR